MRPQAEIQSGRNMKQKAVLLTRHRYADWKRALQEMPCGLYRVKRFKMRVA
jgi:hypothetical protein